MFILTLGTVQVRRNMPFLRLHFVYLVVMKWRLWFQLSRWSVQQNVVSWFLTSCFQHFGSSKEFWVHMNVHTSSNVIPIIVYHGHICVMASLIVLCWMMKKIAVNGIVYTCFDVNNPLCVFTWMICATEKLIAFMERMSSCVIYRPAQDHVPAFSMLCLVH